MDTLILEDVRCFRGRHEIPLAPLTLIVGENSTGKSTLLAATRLAWDMGQRTRTPDFNEEPFDWGAWDQIAHYRRGQRERVERFTIGCDLTIEHSRRVRVEAVFLQRRAQPVLEQLRFEAKPHSVTVKYGENNQPIELVAKAGRKHKTYRLDDLLIGPAGFLVLHQLRKDDYFTKAESKTFVALSHMAEIATERRPKAIAPVRTRPRRTYDRRSEATRPEGEHVPMILATMKTSNPDEWDQLRNELRKFGRDSGLFRGIDIKRLGRKESDPFQVRVAVSGTPANLVDVGYGVSQALPLVVDCLRSEPGETFLMQQPEVHLHPRAQAELGTLMGYLVKERRHRLMVETHSDYLVDRIRMDIRDGKHLSPDDVSLLYCEQTKEGVQVHRIEIDARGNLLNPPPGYRRFFMEEEKRLFEGG